MRMSGRGRSVRGSPAATGVIAVCKHNSHALNHHKGSLIWTVSIRFGFECVRKGPVVGFCEQDSVPPCYVNDGECILVLSLRSSANAIISFVG
jgi:hypothetical protein